MNDILVDDISVDDMRNGKRNGRKAAVLAAVAFLALAQVLPLMAGSAFAEEGHNHGPAPRTISVAPRTEARIGNQEAVLAYDRGKLVLFLQRYADGQPTSGAQIEMTIDFVPVTFEEVAPGTYVASDVMLAAGRNDLELSYKIGERDGTDTLTLNLPQGATETTATRKMNAPGSAVSGLLLAGLAIAIYAAMTALLALRSRTA